MAKINTYRNVTIALLVIFFVSNIGLPIVIASCPMMFTKTTQASCCSKPSDSLPSFHTSKDYSCCKTVIAAERNTNEFVIAKYVTDTPHHSVTIIQRLENFSSFSSTHLLSTVSFKLLATEDIPVFNSTLLI